MNKILIFIFLVFSCCLLQAQQPQAPKIVRFDHLNQNYYKIYWNKVEGAESYSIGYFKFSTDNNQAPADTPIKEGITDTSERVEILPDEIKFFYVKAFVGGKYSPLSLWPWKNAPSNILLKHEFDTCNPGKLILRWNQFYYPDPKDGKYTLFYKESSRFNKNEFTYLDSSTAVVINNIENFLDENNEITIQVSKTIPFGTDVLTVYSNKITFKMPVLPKGPSFLEATGTEIWDEKEQVSAAELQKVTQEEPAKIKLNFYVDLNSELNKYVVYRSENAIVGFDSIGTIEDPGANLSYEDEVDALSKKQYFYKIAAINNCGNIVKESNVTSSIPPSLSAEENNSFYLISWPSYHKFNGDLKEYQVYRVRAGHKPHKLNNTKGLSERDDLSLIPIMTPLEKICYYVVAIEENNSNKTNGRAVSNLVCKTLNSSIVMPKYLVLDESCKPSNKQFKPEGDIAPPAKWYIVIMDRWGTKIFESDDFYVGWDGSYANGKTAPQGGYVYFYKMTTTEGKNIEDYGSFVLLCN